MSHWSLLAPEFALAGVVLLLLAMDLCRATRNVSALSGVALAGLAVSTGLLWQQRHVTGASAANGMYLCDPFAVGLKLLFFGAAAVVVVMLREWMAHHPGPRGEFFLLLLLATTGMSFLVSAGDFLLLFIALELMTFSFYIMTAYLRTDVRSIEAGLKYLILGAMASGCLLYGTSLLYGATGATRFDLIRQHLAAHPASPLVIGGNVLVLAGLAFKLSAVPFHWWVPDVYQGAPTPVTAFLAAGSKAAGFAVVLRLVPVLFGPVWMDRWTPLVAAAAAVTMCYGNLVALAQTNIKRLLAYSSIGHAGYLLLGLATMSPVGTSAMLFYLAAYALMTLTAFAVVVCVANATGSDELSAYEGLSQRAPFLAGAMFIALLSLAGVPPLIGFFGKLWLLLAAVQRGLLWLVVVGAVNVVISLYYYLLVVKRMYLDPPQPALMQVPVSWPMRLTVYACLAGILILGIFQRPLVTFALHAARGL